MQSLQKRAHKQLIAAEFLEQRVYKEASAVRRGRARSPACPVARSRSRAHALFKIVWYVLLRPLRPELDGRPSSANFSYSCTKLVATIYLLH
jgi:hypothetical protein